MAFVQIAYGSSRVALLLPHLGICVKFARVSCVHFFYELYLDWRIGGLRRMRLRFKLPVESPYSSKGRLLRGLVENLREARFSRHFQDPVIAVTYFTWFGMFNVQEWRPASPLHRNGHWSWLQSTISPSVLDGVGDLHGLAVANFGLREDRACLVDYASLPIQALLRTHGERLRGVPYVAP